MLQNMLWRYCPPLSRPGGSAHPASPTTTPRLAHTTSPVTVSPLDLAPLAGDLVHFGHSAQSTIRAGQKPTFDNIPYSISQQQMLKDYPWLAGYIERLRSTPAFERLSEIQQTGFSSKTYPAATHTRYEHSLGVADKAIYLIDQLKQQGHTFTEREVATFVLAALLHDVGHGFRSHALENAMRSEQAQQHGKRVSHEARSEAILTGNTQINALLNEYSQALRRDDPAVNGDIDLPRDILNMLESSNHWLAPLLHGSLDIDRLDYLLRDALHANSDLQAKIATSPEDVKTLLGSVRRDSQGNACFSESVVPLIKDFLADRLLMYRQMYYADNTNAADAMMEMLFTRLLEIADTPTPPELAQQRSNIALQGELFTLHSEKPNGALTFALNLDQHTLHPAEAYPEPTELSLDRRRWNRLWQAFGATQPSTVPEYPETTYRKWNRTRFMKFFADTGPTSLHEFLALRDRQLNEFLEFCATESTDPVIKRLSSALIPPDADRDIQPHALYSAINVIDTAYQSGRKSLTDAQKQELKDKLAAFQNDSSLQPFFDSKQIAVKSYDRDGYTIPKQKTGEGKASFLKRQRAKEVWILPESAKINSRSQMANRLSKPLSQIQPNLNLPADVYIERIFFDMEDESCRNAVRKACKQHFGFDIARGERGLKDWPKS
ncbi:MAG: HD domain-containing protein [Candidatus Melainabacteria bacterium]|nr:HD domain-containing protein [Candidatus Melainabacteria bacterium]